MDPPWGVGLATPSLNFVFQLPSLPVMPIHKVVTITNNLLSLIITMYLLHCFGWSWYRHQYNKEAKMGKTQHNHLQYKSFYNWIIIDFHLLDIFQGVSIYMTAQQCTLIKCMLSSEKNVAVPCAMQGCHQVLKQPYSANGDSPVTSQNNF